MRLIGHMCSRAPVVAFSWWLISLPTKMEFLKQQQIKHSAPVVLFEEKRLFFTMTDDSLISIYKSNYIPDPVPDLYVCVLA